MEKKIQANNPFHHEFWWSHFFCDSRETSLDSTMQKAKLFLKSSLHWRSGFI